MSRTDSHTWHVPALDGIRGVAILLVIYQHAPQFLPAGGVELGGCFGVDLFFVLSGFLITTLLLREFRGTGTIRLGLFYARRALRLFPALACFLAAALILDRFNPKAIPDGADFWSSVFYLANWRMVQRGDITMGVLNHIWSLSIEEQFYLLFPPIVLILLRNGWASPRLARLFTALAAISGLLMAGHFIGAGWVRAYFGSDSRAFTILAGAAGAVIVSGTEPIFDRFRVLIERSRPAAVILLAVCLVISTPREAIFHLGGAALFSAAATVIVAAVAMDRGGPLQPLLTAGWLRYLGKISYGLYLYHFLALWALIPFFKTVPSLLILVLYPALTLWFSVVSWRFIERPALKFKDRFHSPLLGRTGSVIAAARSTSGTKGEKD